MKTFDGAFLVYKDKGMTSHDVVFKLRKILKDKQIGHTGTLDPMATGLMICLVGASAKLAPYLGSENKKYELELELGKVTDSWDITGDILRTNPVAVTSDEIKKQILALQGEVKFEIPMYSAKKIDGKKLYEIARSGNAGTDFLGPKKEMKFWDLKNVQVIKEDGEESSAEGKTTKVNLEFWCSKGSFVRSWVYQLGEKLKVGAVLTALRRSAIDNYDLSEAQSLSEIEADVKQEKIPKSYKTRLQLVDKFETFFITENEYKRLLDGLISYELQNRIEKHNTSSPYLFCVFENQLVGIIELGPESRLKKVFK